MCWRLSCREYNVLWSREWTQIATNPTKLSFVVMILRVQSGLALLNPLLQPIWISPGGRITFQNTSLGGPPCPWLVWVRGYSGWLPSSALPWLMVWSLHPPHYPSSLSPLSPSSLLSSSLLSFPLLPSLPLFSIKERDKGWQRHGKHSSENKSSWCACWVAAFCCSVHWGLAFGGE